MLLIKRLLCELSWIVLTVSAAQAQGTNTFTEAFPIAYGLNLVSAQVGPLAHSTTIVTPLVGQRFYLQNNVIVYADDTAFRRIKLERRIDDEYAAGRLSSKQVGELKKNLNEYRLYGNSLYTSWRNQQQQQKAH